MLLPSELQKFSHPTLIVLTDHIHAKLWLAHELELKEIDHLDMPRERMTDREEIETDADPDRLHRMMKELASRITHHATNAQHIYLAMKADIMHALEKELPSPTKNLINRRQPHDLMKEEMLDVVKRFF